MTFDVGLGGKRYGLALVLLSCGCGAEIGPDAILCTSGVVSTRDIDVGDSTWILEDQAPIDMLRWAERELSSVEVMSGKTGETDVWSFSFWSPRAQVVTLSQGAAWEPLCRFRPHYVVLDVQASVVGTSGMEGVGALRLFGREAPNTTSVFVDGGLALTVVPESWSALEVETRVFGEPREIDFNLNTAYWHGEIDISVDGPALGDNSLEDFSMGLSANTFGDEMTTVQSLGLWERR